MAAMWLAAESQFTLLEMRYKSQSLSQSQFLQLVPFLVTRNMLSGPSSNPPYCGFDIPAESLGYWVNCDCNATIPGDPDIAGPGVGDVLIQILVTTNIAR